MFLEQFEEIIQSADTKKRGYIAQFKEMSIEARLAFFFGSERDNKSPAMLVAEGPALLLVKFLEELATQVDQHGAAILVLLCGTQNGRRPHNPLASSILMNSDQKVQNAFFSLLALLQQKLGEQKVFREVEQVCATPELSAANIRIRHVQWKVRARVFEGLHEHEKFSFLIRNDFKPYDSNDIPTLENREEGATILLAVREEPELAAKWIDSVAHSTTRERARVLDIASIPTLGYSILKSQNKALRSAWIALLKTTFVLYGEKEVNSRLDHSLLPFIGLPRTGSVRALDVYQVVSEHFAAGLISDDLFLTRIEPVLIKKPENFELRHYYSFLIELIDGDLADLALKTYEMFLKSRGTLTVHSDNFSMLLRLNLALIKSGRLAFEESFALLKFERVQGIYAECCFREYLNFLKAARAAGIQPERIAQRLNRPPFWLESNWQTSQSDHSLVAEVMSLFRELGEEYFDFVLSLFDEGVPRSELNDLNYQWDGSLVAKLFPNMTQMSSPAYNYASFGEGRALFNLIRCGYIPATYHHLFAKFKPVLLQYAMSFSGEELLRWLGEINTPGTPLNAYFSQQRGWFKSSIAASITSARELLRQNDPGAAIYPRLAFAASQWMGNRPTLRDLDKVEKIYWDVSQGNPPDTRSFIATINLLQPMVRREVAREINEDTRWNRVGSDTEKERVRVFLATISVSRLSSFPVSTVGQIAAHKLPKQQLPIVKEPPKAWAAARMSLVEKRSAFVNKTKSSSPSSSSLSVANEVGISETEALAMQSIASQPDASAPLMEGQSVVVQAITETEALAMQSIANQPDASAPALAAEHDDSDKDQSAQAVELRVANEVGISETEKLAMQSIASQPDASAPVAESEHERVKQGPHSPARAVVAVGEFPPKARSQKLISSPSVANVDDDNEVVIPNNLPDEYRECYPHLSEAMRSFLNSFNGEFTLKADVEKYNLQLPRELCEEIFEGDPTPMDVPVILDGDRFNLLTLLRLPLLLGMTLINPSNNQTVYLQQLDSNALKEQSHFLDSKTLQPISVEKLLLMRANAMRLHPLRANQRFQLIEIQRDFRTLQAVRERIAKAKAAAENNVLVSQADAAAHADQLEFPAAPDHALVQQQSAVQQRTAVAGM